MNARKPANTILGEVYEKFAVETPVAVMVRVTLERCLGPEVIDQLFHDTSHRQYNRELLFSTVFKVLSEVVFNVQRSVYSVYQRRREQMGVSVGALYEKLAGTEPAVLSALVRHTAQELGAVLEHMEGASLPTLLPGRAVRIVDGNSPEATQRRLKPLRRLWDRPLPAKAMVVLDPARLLILEVLPCEDGQASERTLIKPVLEWVRPGEVWIADRNLCVWDFMEGVSRAGACFVVRHHGQFKPQELEAFQVVGRNPSGVVSEQKVRGQQPDGQWREMRRIGVQLDRPTREGEREVFVLTNLPAQEVDALQVAELYLNRWTIERVFQEIEANLCSEINTLAYPRAALFGLCVGFVAYNVLALVKGAMRAVHGAQKVEQEISFYYLSEELENTHRGLHIAVGESTWAQFRQMSPEQTAQELMRLAKAMDPRRYKKHPRGPKKPQPPRRRLARGGIASHVSTARLLLGIT